MRPDDDSGPPDEPPSDAGSADTRDDDARVGEQDLSRPEERSEGLIRRIATATDGLLLVVRETTLSVGAVVTVGLLLFAISGVWPPMVAVESGSMEPHMHKGDLVFITDSDRFAPDAALNDTGIVTRDTARETGYWKFGAHGSVIVYDNPTRGGPPVIHRAQFWVNEGENWYDQANPEYVSASGCDEMPNCPAPNAGFVTKGDANEGYDQVNGISEPVKPAWIVGVARVRIPYLGWVRLGVSDLALEMTLETDAVLHDEQGATAEPTAPSAARSLSTPATVSTR